MLQRPTGRQMAVCAVALAVWLAVTAVFVGFRPEHIVLAALIFGLFVFNGATRRLVVALVPFALFGISYDWMNIVPNYTVNPVDVEGLYNTEKGLFGIIAGAEVLTPNEFFAIHHSTVADIAAGIFYLCWVPLPIFFGLWLYFTGKKSAYLHFAIVFLLVNWLGFTVYYLHPAAPPWYVALHGFEAVPGTPGDVAGLGRFDQLTGLGIFDALYARNANVFAALPSLHSAYTPVALIYAIRSRSSRVWIAILAVVSVGIWWTAVYSSHHYIIDVLCGILCALTGFVLFEYGLMRLKPVRRFMDAYTNFITKK